MAEQAEQRETVQEDLDARVDALLREMEETSDRVVRRMQEDDADDGPTLKDLAPAAGASDGGDAGAGEPGGWRGDDVGAAARAADGGTREGERRSVMQEAAAELSGAGLGAAAANGAVKAHAASADVDAAEGASVEALDELLAAAAADVMAYEGDEVEDESALDAAVAGEASAESAEQDDGAGSGSGPVVTLEPGRGAVVPRGGEARGAADEGTSEGRPGRGRAEAVAGAAAVSVEGADEFAAAAQSGPPHAPAATMAPAAERPGWARRVVDVFVHNAMGAAASVRPHAIRFAWRLEQYTLQLSPGARATIKCVALWTLFNAAGAWVFVMMRTPAQPPVVKEATPTVISGAPVADAGELR